MNRDEITQKILKEYLSQATPEQRRELQHLLDGKRKSGGIGGMNISGMARGMAREIQQQMGLTQENIRRTARDLVIRLAKQHKPDITDRELEELLENMVPGSSGRGPAPRQLPPDLMKTMIMQYVLFRTGRMSREELQDLPPGWHKKYWQSFPGEIQNHINQFLEYSIEPREFWSRIRSALQRREK